MATIECKPDGPYLVKDLEVLVGADGNRITANPVMALCRCGGSATKPFCDGTHRKNGFSGARLGGGSEDRRDDYRGAAVTIHDNRALCAHAGRCTDKLAAVFKYGEEPWIDPDGAAAGAVAEAVRNCPSGALGYSLAGVEQVDAMPGEPAVVVARDGPYEVTGVRLEGQAWLRGASEQRYTLCRCGGSRNKPFCDGTHWSIGFKDGG